MGAIVLATKDYDHPHHPRKRNVHAGWLWTVPRDQFQQIQAAGGFSPPMHKRVEGTSVFQLVAFVRSELGARLVGRAL
jgi:hypothetical protein